MLKGYRLLTPNGQKLFDIRHLTFAKQLVFSRLGHALFPWGNANRTAKPTLA